MEWEIRKVLYSQKIKIPVCDNLSIILVGGGGGGAGALFDNITNNFDDVYSSGGGGGGNAENVLLGVCDLKKPIEVKVKIGKGGKYGIGGINNIAKNGGNGCSTKIRIWNKIYKAHGGKGGFIGVSSQYGGNGGRGYNGGGGGGGGYLQGGEGGKNFNNNYMGQNGFNRDSINNFMSGGVGYNNPNSNASGSIISINSSKLGYVGGGGSGGGLNGGQGGICGPNPGGSGSLYGSGGGGGAGFNLQSINGANGGAGANGVVIIRYKKCNDKKNRPCCSKNHDIKIKKNVSFDEYMDKLENIQVIMSNDVKIADDIPCLTLNPMYIKSGVNQNVNIGQIAGQLQLYNIKITAVGGGGGGASGGNPVSRTGNNNGGGGGGGGSGFQVEYYQEFVSSETILNYTIGIGGLGQDHSTDALDGKPTNFSLSGMQEPLKANGGGRGINGYLRDGGKGGDGYCGGGGGGGGSPENQNKEGGNGGAYGTGNDIMMNGKPGQKYTGTYTGYGGDGGCPNSGKGGVISSFGGCGGGGGGEGGGDGGAGFTRFDNGKNGLEGSGSGGGGGPGTGPGILVHNSFGGNGGSGYIKIEFS